MEKGQVEVRGVTVRYGKVNDNNYISLTDIAKTRNEENPNGVISNWMRSRTTIEYLGLWETLYNIDFNPVEFEGFKSQAGLHAFTLSPKQWIEKTNAIGITVKSGRYNGGTFAHQDIAFKFASWLSAEFELYLIKEFERLKLEEQKELEWTAKRELAKLNYRIHTDAIKENIIPALEEWQVSFAYANEADVLNVALFGKTAKDWREENPDKKGNIRDYATIEQLLIIANMESFNAILIENGMSQGERLKQLNAMAISQMRTLQGRDLSKLIATKKR